MIPLYIFIGGGIGSLIRYGLTLLLPAEKFPFGTLVCNLLGCFLIGLLAGYFSKPSALQIGMITGLLGGFTTFSAFSYATLKLFQGGNFLAAVSHLLLSVIGGLIMTYVGYQSVTHFAD